MRCTDGGSSAGSGSLAGSLASGLDTLDNLQTLLTAFGADSEASLTRWAPATTVNTSTLIM